LPGDFVLDNKTPNADNNSVSATVRFALAAVCCSVFVVTVVMLAGVTAKSPLQPLREVAFTFWGVFLNFALCLGTVAYVSRRLHKTRTDRAGTR
jgi:hypothetical protein